MSDFIESLPSDEAPLSDAEQALLNNIIKDDSSGIRKVIIEFRDPLLIAVMFVLLSLPQVSDFIGRVLPYANSSFLAMIAIKAAVFSVIWLLIKNRKF